MGTPKKMGFLTGIKKNAIIYGFILAVVAFFFGFGHNARADTLSVSQDWSGASYLDINTLVGQSWVASSTSISSIWILGINDAGIGTTTLTICRGEITNYQATTTAINCGFLGNAFVYMANIKPTLNLTWHIYTLPTIVETYPGYLYYFILESAPFYVMQSYTIDRFIYGREIYWASDEPNDLTFRIYSPTNPNDINYTSPINNFNYNTGYIYFTGTANTGVEYLNIWLDDLARGDTYHLLNYINASSSIYNWSFVQHLTASSTYKVRYLYGGMGENKTASTTFTILSSATTTDSGNVFNCTIFKSSCAITASTTFATDFKCYLQRGVEWLLCPSSEYIMEIRQTKNLLYESFPFSTFFKLTDDITSALATTSTSTDETFGVPMIRTIGTTTEFYIVPILSSSSLSLVLGNENAGMIRTTLNYFIWIFVVGIMFIIIKK